MIDCAVEIDGRFVYAMRADGIIVATPTGSTAYALSAGGPILDPQVPAFALVPVAPHALTHRPIAIADTATIAHHASSAAATPALHCDGQAHFALAEGERVTVARAPHSRALPAPRGPRLFRDAAREAALERDAGARCAAAARAHAADAAMLRSLSIRNFVVVDALDLELDARLHGPDRRNRRGQVDPARRARPAARRPLRAAAAAAGRRARRARRRLRRRPTSPAVAAWLAEQDARPPTTARCCCAASLDAQGRSRAWINGRPATLAQLKELGERLVDLHGQHAHQSLDARRGAARARRCVRRLHGARARSGGRAGARGAPPSSKRDAAAQAAHGDGRRARIPRRAPARARGARRLRRRMGRRSTPAQSRLAHAADADRRGERRARRR